MSRIEDDCAGDGQSMNEIIPNKYDRADLPLRENNLEERAIREDKPKNNRVEINQLDHGYEVRVGCKVFAIEGMDRLLALLRHYMMYPHIVTKRYKNTGSIDKAVKEE